MTRIIDRLAEISDPYDALFCDLWGCLHNGVQAFPAAIAALQQFRAQGGRGGRVILLTNAPRPAADVAAQLDGLKVPRDCWDAIATSGDCAREALFAGVIGQNVYHIGPDKDLGFFTPPEDMKNPLPIHRVPLEKAEGIACTGLFDDRTETPEEYRPTLLYAKQKGLKLLCANPDIVFDLGDKRYYCAGAIAQLYTEMGGQSLYFGKPLPPIYDRARHQLAALGAPVPDDAILCIGDGIGTDIQGAISEDLDSLFVTGGLAASETGTSDQPDASPEPDRLAAFLRLHMLSPNFAIGRLR